jgi:hypothetical protein
MPVSNSGHHDDMMREQFIRQEILDQEIRDGEFRRDDHAARNRAGSPHPHAHHAFPGTAFSPLGAAALHDASQVTARLSSFVNDLWGHPNRPGADAANAANNANGAAGNVHTPPDPLNQAEQMERDIKEQALYGTLKAIMSKVQAIANQMNEGARALLQLSR